MQFRSIETQFITLLSGAAAWPLVARTAASDAGDRISECKDARELRSKFSPNSAEALPKLALAKGRMSRAL